MIKYIQNPTNWAHQNPPKILVESPNHWERGLMNHPEFLYQKLIVWHYSVCCPSQYLGRIARCPSYNIDFVHMDEENHQLRQAIAAKLATL